MLCKSSFMSSINEIFTWIAQNIQIILAATNTEQGIIVVMLISWVLLGEVCRIPLLRNPLNNFIFVCFLHSTWSYWKHLQLCLLVSQKIQAQWLWKMLMYKESVTALAPCPTARETPSLLLVQDLFPVCWYWKCDWFQLCWYWKCVLV